MNAPNDTILIIDDNPANLRLLRMLLAEHGYAVRLATNGTMALASARTEPPDLVLLDIHLPSLKGNDILAYIRNNEPFHQTDVIIVTADRKLGRELQQRPEIVLIKPVSVPQLRDLADFIRRR